MVTKYPVHPLVEVFQPYDAERYETLTRQQQRLSRVAPADNHLARRGD